MILRRLADGIRKQDWFTVLVEVLIVVVGIFLGLQVDDWNKERQNRELEQQYLERLHADAITAVKRQINARGWNDERIRTQMVVLKALRSGNLPDDLLNDFSTGLTHAGSHNPLIWQWGTVEELYSTGNIRLIRETELRDLIFATETNYRRHREIIAGATQQIHISRGQISLRFDPVEFGYSSGDSAIVHFDFDALVSDDEFVAAFSNLHLNSMRILSFSESHLESLQQFEAGIARTRGLVPLADKRDEQQ